MPDMKILLRCAKSGNADAFGQMYSIYARELYLYALKYLGNPEDAEDTVQQASLNVYKSINNVKSADSFKSYYFKAVANTARSKLAKAPLYELSSADTEAISDSTCFEDSVVESDALLTALNTLSLQEKEIVLLSVVAGLNSKEISRITDLTAGAVRSKLSRSLTKLRSTMKNNER